MRAHNTDPGTTYGGSRRHDHRADVRSSSRMVVLLLGGVLAALPLTSEQRGDHAAGGLRGHGPGERLPAVVPGQHRYPRRAVPGPGGRELHRRRGCRLRPGQADGVPDQLPLGVLLPQRPVRPPGDPGLQGCEGRPDLDPEQPRGCLRQRCPEVRRPDGLRPRPADPDRWPLPQVDLPGDRARTGASASPPTPTVPCPATRARPTSAALRSHPTSVTSSWPSPAPTPPASCAGTRPSRRPLRAATSVTAPPCTRSSAARTATSSGSPVRAPTTTPRSTCRPTCSPLPASWPARCRRPRAR